MGEAKRRGTKAERVAQAISRQAIEMVGTNEALAKTLVIVENAGRHDLTPRIMHMANQLGFVPVVVSA